MGDAKGLAVGWAVGCAGLYQLSEDLAVGEAASMMWKEFFAGLAAGELAVGERFLRFIQTTSRPRVAASWSSGGSRNTRIAATGHASGRVTRTQPHAEACNCSLHLLPVESGKL